MSVRRIALPLAVAILGMSSPSASAVNLDNVQRLIASPEEPTFISDMLKALPEVDQGLSGFDPEGFSEWVDYNGNGCSTRTDLLRYELSDVTVQGCQVVSGEIIDAYSGQSEWLNDTQDVDSVVLDHIVSPEQAWRSGAWSWPEDKRAAFFNDPMNIRVVLPGTSADKAGRGPDSWLPDMAPESYAKIQVRIKSKYGLGVTSAERSAIADIIGVDLDETPESESEVDTSPDDTDHHGSTENNQSEVSNDAESYRVGPIVDTGGQVSGGWWESFKRAISGVFSV